MREKEKEKERAREREKQTGGLELGKGMRQYKWVGGRDTHAHTRAEKENRQTDRQSAHEQDLFKCALQLDQAS